MKLATKHVQNFLRVSHNVVQMIKFRYIKSESCISDVIASSPLSALVRHLGELENSRLSPKESYKVSWNFISPY